MHKSFMAYPAEVREVIYNVKPGLTGIGSIIFRDEEVLITQIKNKGGDTWEFYKEQIYPFKGEVEKWYQKNKSFKNDVIIVFLTIWVVLFPGSKLVYTLFPDLPKRPF